MPYTLQSKNSGASGLDTKHLGSGAVVGSPMGWLLLWTYSATVVDNFVLAGKFATGGYTLEAK